MLTVHRVQGSTPLHRAPVRNFVNSKRHASLLQPFIREPALSAPSREVSRQGLFGLGIPEIAVIAGVAALIFGPSKLPELGKSAGQAAKSFQDAAKEFNEELKRGLEEQPAAEQPAATGDKEGTPAKEGAPVKDTKDASTESKPAAAPASPEVKKEA